MEEEARRDVDAARRETVRYHEELYGQARLGTTGSWLARPHRRVVEALALVDGPVHAYDLGCGIGRHTLLLAAELPAGSRVTAVDLLPSAVARVAEQAEDSGLGDRVEVVAADLEDYRFPASDAGLLVAFSVVEHLPSAEAVAELLDRCRRATRPGGVHVVVVFADRHEAGPGGSRPALVECPLSAEQARHLLALAYRGWQVIVDEVAPTAVRETRGGESYELRSTLVCFVARAPNAG